MYRRATYLCFVLLSFFGSSSAQTSTPHTFDWGFTFLNATTRTLRECDTIPMEALSADGGSVPPSSLDAVPPYIMHSFSPNMVGLQDVVGSNASALNWIVRYPAGSPLILSMVDSGGHQGGVEAQYTVVAGSTNACLPQPVATTFQVTANATILNTCDALKLSISGGKKPYTLSVLITDISEDTVMMGPNDDQFTWINKAPPNTTVLVSAQDANGQMSVSTGLVLTTGGIDVTCPGRQSFPGSSTATSTSMSSTSYSSLSPSPSGTSLPNTGPVKMTRNSNAAVIAGGVAGGITLLLAAFLAVGCLRKKPRAHVSQKVDLEGPSGETGSLLYPTSYASGQSVDRDARSSTRGNSEGFFNGRGRAALNIEVTSPALIHSPPLTNPYGSTSFDSDTASDQGLVYNADRPFSPQYRDEGSSRSRLLVANTDRDPSSSSRASSAYRKTEPPQQEEVIVLRHRDAGPALEELPPAYGEQSNGNR